MTSKRKMTVNEIAERIKIGWPDVAWGMNGEDLSGIVWPDDAGPAPTMEQLAAVEIPYRRQRMRAFNADLGGDPENPLAMITDQIGTIIEELLARGEPVTPKFALLSHQIDAIKKRFPKPPSQPKG